jgi:ankyrin repeat protein
MEHVAGLWPSAQTMGFRQSAAIIAAMSGKRPLFRFIKEGNVPAIKSLLAAGTSPDEANDNGWRPLFLAAHCGNPAVLEALLAAGADVHADEDCWLYRPVRPQFLVRT